MLNARWRPFSSTAFLIVFFHTLKMRNWTSGVNQWRLVPLFICSSKNHIILLSNRCSSVNLLLICCSNNYTLLDSPNSWGCVNFLIDCFLISHYFNPHKAMGKSPLSYFCQFSSLKHILAQGHGSMSWLARTRKTKKGSVFATSVFYTSFFTHS